MRLLGFIFAAALALSVLKAAVTVLLLGIVLALLYGVFFHPAQTFGFLALGAFVSLLQTHPATAFGLIGAGLIAIAIGGAKQDEAEKAEPNTFDK